MLEGVLAGVLEGVKGFYEPSFWRLLTVVAAGSGGGCDGVDGRDGI